MTHYAMPTSLSIPYGDIDAEHQNLVDILNSIALSFKSKQDIGPNPYQSLLGNLLEALSVHFSHEEKEMAKLGYPELAKHKLGHALCYARFNAIFQTVISSHIEMSKELLDEIFDVIVSDMIGADSGFKTFLYDQSILR